MEVFCPVSCQEAKVRLVARKVKVFEEHLLDVLLVPFNGFFQNSFVKHITILPNFFAKHIKILPGNLGKK